MKLIDPHLPEQEQTKMEDDIPLAIIATPNSFTRAQISNYG
jgi:hypothetical protein